MAVDDDVGGVAARGASIFVVSLPMQMRVQLSLEPGPTLGQLARDVRDRPDCVAAHLLALYSNSGVDLAAHQSDRIVVIDLSVSPNGVHFDFLLIPEVMMAQLQERCADGDLVYVVPGETDGGSIRTYAMNADPLTVHASCFERLEDMLASCGACVRLALAEVRGGRSVADLVRSAHQQATA